METHISRNLVPETTGEPDTLVEELTEVKIVDADPSWWVMVEHTSCGNLIRLPFDSHEEATAFLDRIEKAFDAGEHRIRTGQARLISLKSFRQAWVSGSEE